MPSLSKLVLLLAVISVAGCDLAADLDPKTEPTQIYMSEFQGLDYRARPELQRLRESLKSIKNSGDLDGMGQAMIDLGQKYNSLGEQVMRLRDNNVDADVVAYVNQFASRYREIGDLHTKAGQAAIDRDEATMNDLKPQLAQMQTWLDELKSEREKLFETLSARYGGKEFNTVDYH